MAALNTGGTILAVCAVNDQAWSISGFINASKSVTENDSYDARKNHLRADALSRALVGKDGVFDASISSSMPC